MLTTFPEMFAPEPPAALGVSIPGRAIREGRLELHASDIRAHTTNKHQKTDDRPFGGGPGMVMMCQPVWDAVQAVEASDERPATRIHLTPQGTPMTQSIISALATKPRLLMLAGHYEGIDERVIERLDPIELSIGDFVLSGGELAAMALIDAVARLLPGVLGHADSAGQDSFSPPDERDPDGHPIPDRVLESLGIGRDDRLLDCPHYTRPRIWDGLEVPEILCSGDHEAVARWRLEQRLARTRARRPDLLRRDAHLPPDPGR